MGVTDSESVFQPYVLLIDRIAKENEMLVDVRLAKIQTDYKREQLAKLYGKGPRRIQGEESVADKRPLRLALRARFPVLNR